MCGRIAQYSPPLRYAEFLGLKNATLMFDRADQRAGFNVAPGCHPVAIFGDATLRRIHWGYRPAWAAERGLPQTLNARAETAVAAPYFRPLWRHGRVIVPADGWYEWRIEQGRRQAYYIRLQAEAPLFLAGLTDFQAQPGRPGPAGLVIMTATADSGLIDVHDRRPVVLAAADARRWLDRRESVAAIRRLVLDSALAAEHFTWYPISDAIDKPHADSPSLIQPLTAAQGPAAAAGAY
jgi:putative SOS response-associated peptidase YedK